MSALETILASDPYFSQMFQKAEKLTGRFWFTPIGLTGELDAGNIDSYTQEDVGELKTRFSSEKGYRRQDDEQVDGRPFTHELTLDEFGEFGEWVLNLIKDLPVGETWTSADYPLYRGTALFEEYRQGTSEVWRSYSGLANVQVTGMPGQSGEFGKFTLKVLWTSKPVVVKRTAIPVPVPYVDPCLDCKITITDGGGDSFECYATGLIVSNTLGCGTGFSGNWIVGNNPFGVQGIEDFEGYTDGEVTSNTLTPDSNGFSGNWIVGNNPFLQTFLIDFEGYSDGAVTSDTLAGGDGYDGNWIVGDGP